MDSEDFEAQARMGERPVGNWRGHPVVYVSAAGDSAYGNDSPIPFAYDNDSGRLHLVHPVRLPGGPGGATAFIATDPGGGGRNHDNDVTYPYDDRYFIPPTDGETSTEDT